MWVLFFFPPHGCELCMTTYMWAASEQILLNLLSSHFNVLKGSSGARGRKIQAKECLPPRMLANSSVKVTLARFVTTCEQ